ncbi:DNA repair protein RecN [Arenicella chitinivorans]|uniref:DNA repair protein RecN n=1 Tax=Arenicella chitinivorans TaxID=1329800 RepID=A0A918VPV6_9GAMM|nr:DNA repair protein RecN [Arenicella chitinivorans]GHA15481.1 DNA repair protein RecN [Arenicella chitinivorans]
MALRELHIRNFAIIKQLEIEFDDGLTVVTGETGAGKSILLDALDLLLGARAEPDLVRHGESQCELTAWFDIRGLQSVQSWLQKHDLVGEEDQCLIRRVVRVDKPTKCYLNDQPTTLASLKELGYLLVDIHGQHEHQSLSRSADQRRILDQYSGHVDAIEMMAKLASKIRRLEKELGTTTQVRSDNADKIELIEFQLSEFEEVSVTEGEYAELEVEYARLNNAQALIDGIEQALDRLFLNEDVNLTSELGRQIHALGDLQEFDPTLNTTGELLNSALAQIEEARSELNSVLNKIDQDPERLREIEQRRDTLINLARKHRCSEEALPAKHQALLDELETLKDKSSRPEKLAREIADLKKSYTKIAQAVSEKRQLVAEQLSAEITAQMQDLGMRGGELSIAVEPQISDEIVVTDHGIDQIEFLVSTNHGMPLKPLNKTASGGELSRISLAIQVITSQKLDTPTLIFDEVDVGVGGRVAQIVGTRLRELGNHAQVLCITHQPQVAAQGQQHIYIDKVSDEQGTYSTLVKLDADGRTVEIARMLGGETITDRTRAHAQEMLAANQ